MESEKSIGWHRVLMFLLLVVVFVVPFFMFVITAEEPPAETKTDISEGKKLVEERCVACHDLKRIYKEKADKEEWEKIVDRMIKKGANLNESERALVLEYLLTIEPVDSGGCS